jgi:hypothetical protein
MSSTDLFADLRIDCPNGHDVHAAKTNAQGAAVITKARHGWTWLQRDRKPETPPRHRMPGSALISTASALLLALGLGLLVVSLAAQYRYVLAQRHQIAASMIEAAALDIGMIIFSLLALGLARGGQSAKIERALVVICASGSALMNYAAADVTSPRSVLAFCMPPVFLAVVVDRVVVTVRRHVLGMQAGRSPWAVSGKVALWGLRLVLAPPSTMAGGRRMVLQATPLPGTAPAPAIEAPAVTQAPATGKQARLIELAAARHDLAAVPQASVSGIATELAAEVGLHPGTARRVLLAHVRGLQESDVTS